MNPEFKELKIIFLHPGEAYFTSSPEIVSTVLGSCLTVTMFHRKSKLCGITHAMMPRCSQAGCCKGCEHPYKYVDCSIRHLVKKFDFYNVKRKEIEVKIFGAAGIIESSDEAGKESIGQKNIATAIEVLKEENMILSASDIGGDRGRKIFFLTADGSVYLKRLNKNEKSKSINRR